MVEIINKNVKKKIITPLRFSSYKLVEIIKYNYKVKFSGVV